MRTKKPKAAEPSLRDKLSQNFLRAFEADFASYGAEVIEKLRESHPDRYAEVAVKLIASAQPPAGLFDKAQSFEDIGAGLLKSVGLSDPTPEQIEAAITENDRFVTALQLIAFSTDAKANSNGDAAPAA